jgi:lysozyme family protein
MADFTTAFEYMLPHEDYGLTGKVFTDSNGARVRYGINEKYHPGLEEYYTTMPNDKALQFAKIQYQVWYWSPLNGIMMPDQTVANKAFDQSVPMGVVQSAKCLQRAINLCRTEQLEVDGHVGHLTIAALIELNGSLDLMDHYKDELEHTYQAIVAVHPEDQPLLKGWVNRARL